MHGIIASHHGGRGLLLLAGCQPRDRHELLSIGHMPPLLTIAESLHRIIDGSTRRAPQHQLPPLQVGLQVSVFVEELLPLLTS